MLCMNQIIYLQTLNSVLDKISVQNYLIFALWVALKIQNLGTERWSRV